LVPKQLAPKLWYPSELLRNVGTHQTKGLLLCKYERKAMVVGDVGADGDDHHDYHDNNN
jgi:hypothetical protein